jgi:hypothetical protein
MLHVGNATSALHLINPSKSWGECEVQLHQDDNGDAHVRIILQSSAGWDHDLVAIYPRFGDLDISELGRVGCKGIALEKY